MSSIRSTTLLFLLAVAVPAAQASETEDQFLPAFGLVILNHLNVGNQVYYVQLKRASPTSLQFNLVTESIVKITPAPTDNWAARSELIGQWLAEDPEPPRLSIEFMADGTFRTETTMDTGCPAGSETGTWQYDADTGVLAQRVITDTSGECGFADSTTGPPGVFRARMDGNDLVIQVHVVDDGIPMQIDVRFLPD